MRVQPQWGASWRSRSLGHVESPGAPQMAHPRETQAGPAPPRRNPTPGSEALCSPTIYPPGEAQHLLIKNISIMVNDLVSPLIQYDDRCKGKMGVRCCCSMLPAPRCLSASALLHGASSLPPPHPTPDIHRLHACVGWKIVPFAVSDKSMFKCIWKVPLGATPERRVKWVIRFLFVGECLPSDSAEWCHFEQLMFPVTLNRQTD